MSGGRVNSGENKVFTFGISRLHLLFGHYQIAHLSSVLAFNLFEKQNALWVKSITTHQTHV